MSKIEKKDIFCECKEPELLDDLQKTVCSCGGIVFHIMFKKLIVGQIFEVDGKKYKVIDVDNVIDTHKHDLFIHSIMSNDGHSIVVKEINEQD